MINLRLSLCVVLAVVTCGPARAQTVDELVVQAREALRKKDRGALGAARAAVVRAGHPLAGWVAYWELSNRLDTAQQGELDAFAARWAGTYVEDRLRNDWLLELGRRRDWVNVRAEFPRFRMNDDREVACYALLTQHLDGQDVRATARAAWYAQRDLDDGCALLATTLYTAGALKADDVWQEARLSLDAGRPRAVRAAAARISAADERAVIDLMDNPARFLARQPAGVVKHPDLILLALMRLAAVDPDQAAAQIEDGWGRRLPRPLAALAWAHVGKQAAFRHLPQAADHSRRAWQVWDASSAATLGQPPNWGDDVLASQVRAALRQPAGDERRWQLVQRAIDAMSAGEQREAVWVYWRARAQQAGAAPGLDGHAERAVARAALEAVARGTGYYGRLAQEELGPIAAQAAAPSPLSPAEAAQLRGIAGLARALQLIDLGLRNEGVREWNYSLRGLGERELLAAAQWACQREVWDRCISTSERTRAEVDVTQRYPLPWREQVTAAAAGAGLDAAVVYGLIRQESRFVVDARSSVGASGLMQLMPATAKWTAGKVGLAYQPSAIADRDVNLQLGSAYLRRVLDNLDGSLPMAAAAYNAGPNRVHRWRQGAPMEAAAWVETIPFHETRDYVKKVLDNAVQYTAMLGRPAPTLKSLLGKEIGTRSAAGPAPDRDLP